MKIYVTAVQALLNKETQDETKIGGKTSLGPSYFLLLKFSFPVNAFDALLGRNWAFSPPNRLTLQITLFMYHI